MPYIHHNLYRLYIIKIAKWFMLTMPILMIFYGDMGFSTEQSFILKACYSIAIVVFEIPSGYAADVWGRKITISIGSVLGCVGFLIYSLFSGFYTFMMAEIILGLGMSFISGADSAMIYDTLKAHNREKDFMKYEGRNFSVGNFAEALAGLAGGALAYANLRYPFYAQTIIASVAIPASLTLIEPTIHVDRAKKGIRDIISVVENALVRNKALRWNLLFSSIMGSATLAMAWIYPVRLLQLGYNEIEIGTTHTILNLLLGMVTLFSYRIEQKLKPRLTVWITSIAITGGFVLAGLGNHYFMVITLLIFYFCRGIATPVLKDYINRITTSDVRATVLSIRSLLIRAFFSIIGPLFGYLTDHFSLEQAFILLGSVFIAITITSISLFLNTLPRNDQS